MNNKTEPADVEHAPALTVDERDIQNANEVIRKQALFALSLLSGCLEGCNALVQSWTEGRREAISRLMKHLAQAGDEPDATKRAALMSTAYMDEWQIFCKELTAANMRALAIGSSYATKAVNRAMSETRAAASETASDVGAAGPRRPKRGRQ